LTPARGGNNGGESLDIKNCSALPEADWESVGAAFRNSLGVIAMHGWWTGSSNMD